jgi:membrane-bound lytic murein transglycosylase D
MKFKILLASVLVIAGCQTTKETTQVDTNQTKTVVEQPTNTPVVTVVPVVPVLNLSCTTSQNKLKNEACR